MNLKTLLIGASLASAVGGCAAPTPYFDEHFGLAVNAAKAQQTLNPDASRNTDPVAGIDGTAADHAIDEYHGSFKAPAPTFPVINVGVGGGSR
jgi:hypothetical protein